MGRSDEPVSELEAILGLSLNSPEVRLLVRECARLLNYPTNIRRAAILRAAEELKVAVEVLQHAVDVLDKVA